MEKFYLGMDIGTDSVGMACTDEQYNLLRAKGKNLWAVRLFDEAQPASDRRAKRTARRRLQRRRKRIELLQDIFSPFIEDSTFFIRLNNSAFHVEDKHQSLRTRFSLFADEGYTDVQFYKKYPTIYHLRCALINGEETDLRHYYLAMHHIIKYRGHFLFEGEGMGAIRDITKLFEDFNNLVEDLALETDLQLSTEKAKEFVTLALSPTGLNDKKKQAISLFSATSSEQKEWLALLLGAKVSPSKLFGEEYAETYKEVKSFSFKTLADDDFEAMSQPLEEEHYALLESARAIYNFTVFEKVLNGQQSISTAMVELYEKHKNDLAMLKKFVKENCSQEVYYQIFRSKTESANYVNYIGYNKTDGKKQFVTKCKTAEEFYKFLNKVLPANVSTDNETLAKIREEIKNETFLPKILNADNGVFPHQINGMDLDAILTNLCKQYPQFGQKGEDGYSLAEKIKKIFLFKIPYFVGPLGNLGNNRWMVRNEGQTGPITPWNFDEVVNKTESSEQFIRRMTNKCTYLHGKDVLPQGSMYYQAYNVLNQINKLTVDGAPISVELKQEIFQNVYLKNKKVGKKQIKQYLATSGKCTLAEADVVLGGFDNDTDLKVSMSSYCLFKEKFGKLVDIHPEIFEDIILWHTLNTDKSLVENAILQKYGNVSEIASNIKWLKGLTSFKEFGRLSKELLCEIEGGVDPVNGDVYTVLNRLYHTNCNFMQLLNSDEYNFLDAIQEENSGEEKEITYEDVEELYISPMVRRGVWQALQMTDEYVKAVGKAPNKIFIEVTRQDGEKGDKGRTVSRKNKLLELYKGLGQDCADIDALMQQLNAEDMTDSRLRSERLYLYFLQLGRCAYTGERINLDELATDLYDVDHIVPQSMVKDDSLDNKVLVLRNKNAEKTNIYPLPQGFTNQQSFWKVLKSKNLMSDKKYAALTRTKPLTDDDFRDFVNRQLVVTNQTVKAVAELLARKFQKFGTKIVYSKAKNVDEFKKKFNLVKCRETNDLHHARDAYLNVVVGNIFDTKFSSAGAYFYTDKEGVSRGYNLENIFYWKIVGAWNGKDDVERVKAVLSKPSMTVTRYSFTNQGAFYNETIYGKGETGIDAPRKNCFPYNQTEKYGGYKSLATAYFAIVQSKDKKGNFIKTIEAIPVLVDYNAKTDSNAIAQYLQKCGLVEPQILVSKLKIKSLVSINGYKASLAGKTGDRIVVHNAQQWFTNSETDLYVKQLAKLLEMDKNGKLAESEKQKDEIALTSNRHKVTLWATKERNLQLYALIINTLGKKCYQGLSSVGSFASKLQQKQQLFENLSTFEQIKVLLQIVRFMKCNAEVADLSLLKDGKSCGKLLIGKNITDVDFAIIHQSPCGLVERVQKV